MSQRDTRIIIIGAGVGGLAAAVDLAARGCRVRVIERAPRAGGKMRSTAVNGQEIDAGPTVLTMPWVFDELFERAGASFRAEVALERAAILARHFWSDGTQLDLHADREASAQAIAQVFGADSGRDYLEFCAYARRIFEAVDQPFLRAQRLSLRGLLRRDAPRMPLSTLARIDARRTMWRALERHFDEPRLRQLLGRYATYCGSSPFAAPATLNLIHHVEAEGVYRVAGGMRALAGALERLARQLGVELVFGTHVEAIATRGRHVSGVEAGGNFFPADVVLFNGDVAAVGSGLLGQPASVAVRPTAPRSRSLSAVTWAVIGQPRGASLLHHNVFFSDDYAAEFEDLMRRRRVPQHPTVYICAQDRGDAAQAPATERLLVLINAPATGDDAAAWTAEERARCEEVTQTMLRACGLELQLKQSVQTTPLEFQELFPATGGALYGPIASGSMSALARQGAESKLKGLYWAGGSVHPGAGVPMAALSGGLAAARILAKIDATKRKSRGRASTGRSQMEATSGTTSTG